MKEVVIYLARAVVETPEAVRVSQRLEAGRTVYRISVAEGERGRVIGKRGRVIESIRTVVRAFSTGRATVEVE
jgi:predicted RNA-binding protein YlqC (UPF0109 family)